MAVNDTSAAQPKTPADAFPNREWRRWREYAGQVDDGAIALACLAEAVDDMISARKRGIEQESLRQIARRARLDPSLLSRIRRCETYPRWDLVARLEVVLRRQLWAVTDVVLAQADAPTPPINRTAGNLPAA